MTDEIQPASNAMTKEERERILLFREMFPFLKSPSLPEEEDAKRANYKEQGRPDARVPVRAVSRARDSGVGVGDGVLPVNSKKGAGGS